MKYCLILIALIFFTNVHLTYAQEGNTQSPLNISADGTLEWDRLNQTFTAKGKALAAQDEVSISAEMLTAKYEENKETGDNFDIHTMTATNNVIITSQDSKAYGNKAVYALKNQLATMTGENLQLITPEQTITARDRFEYHVKEGKLMAIGNAVIKRPDDTIGAETITAFLGENQKGERTLEKMIAQNNVIITTATEKITGTYGTYNARTEQAEITGGVTITRGPNILRGDRATVDLKTQISKIFGNKSSQNGRVTGTFYPGSQKEE